MKTTISGILTIIIAVSVAVVSYLKNGTADFGALVAAVTVGVGLIKAADATKATPAVAAPPVA